MRRSECYNYHRYHRPTTGLVERTIKMNISISVLEYFLTSHCIEGITARQLVDFDKTLRWIWRLAFTSLTLSIFILTQGYVYHDPSRPYSVVVDSLMTFHGFGGLALMLVMTGMILKCMKFCTRSFFQLLAVRKQLLTAKMRYCQLFDESSLEDVELSHLENQTRFTLIYNAKKVLVTKLERGEKAFSAERQVLDDMFKSAADFCPVPHYNRIDTAVRRELLKEGKTRPVN